MPVNAIIKENVLKREMKTLQLKILNRSFFVKSNWALVGYFAVKKKCIFGCPTDRHRVSENTRVQVAKDFRFYIPAEARVCDHHNKYL